MARLPTIAYDLHATRVALRFRFSKNLYNALPQTLPLPESPLDDQQVLLLLEDITVHRNRHIDSARDAYRTISEELPGAPSFEALLRSGWLRQVHDELHVNADWGSIGRGNGDIASALRALQKSLYGRRYVVNHPSRHNDAMAPTIALLRDRPGDVQTLQCRTPDWVAARLWERLIAVGDQSLQFARWLDGWTLLGRPSFVPSRAWSVADAAAFTEGALAWLHEPGVLLSWRELACRRDLHSRLVRGEADLLTTATIDESPATLVERFTLLDDPVAARFHDHMLLMAGAPPITALLLEEIEAAEHSQGPHPVAARLFTLAVDKPELLLALKWRAQHQPVLYADLSLFPPTAPVASIWIASGQPQGGGRYPGSTQLDAPTRITAFEDALTTCAHFLQTNQLSTSEFAPVVKLIRERQVHAGPMHQETATAFLTAVRHLLLTQNSTTITALADALIQDAQRPAEGVAALAAALDIVATSLLSDTVDARPVIDAYHKIINSEYWRMPVRHFDVRTAAALLALASRLNRRAQRSFLFAVDMSERRQDAAKDDSRRYQLIDEACQVLRAHVSVLCRCVAGAAGAPPKEVVDALIENIEEGQFTDEHYGPADAFSDRHSVLGFGQAEPSIARDFALALDRLGASERERLLAAILKSSEPVMLAELEQLAPASTKESLGNRLSLLAAPGAAAPVWSLQVVQTRVEELINAGKLDVAQHFLDEEMSAETLGKVPGREQVRLRLTLRLLYARGELDAITSWAAPEGALANDTVTRDLIDFYKALASMRREHRDLQFPISVFSRLQKQHPKVSAYAVNLIAARIQSVLPENIFGQVSVDNREEARCVLADSSTLTDAIREWPSADRDLFSINRAILQLATGNAQEALALLQPVASSSLQTSAMAFFAVALARSGRADDAAKMIDSAASSHADIPLLQAARAQIQSGIGYDSSVLVATADSSTGAILLSHFLARPPHQQAIIFYGSAKVAQEMLVRDVRLSAANVAELAVALRPRKEHPNEDDATKLFGALLEARKRFVAWSWQEQSPGGLAGEGREGRRDLALLEERVAHAVLEAVVCDRPLETKWTSGELLSHYLKLFAYAQCRLFFHVVYNYMEDPQAFLAHLKGVAEREAPKGFDYMARTELEPESSLPPGFVARYRRADTEVAVVFLVVDMRRALQLNSAMMATKANPRKS